MTVSWENKKTESLVDAVLALKNKEEARKFLRDLLTEEEIAEFGNRWLTAQMLSQNVSYNVIRGYTGMSPRTIARISKWLNKGMGGYKLVISRFQKHHHNLFSFEKGPR